MSRKLYIQCLPFLIIGLYMIIMGTVSKTLISESDVPATQEEKLQFKPTSLRRLLIILGGVACITYSLFCIRR